MELAVTPDDARFFGILQLAAEFAPDRDLAAGVRNSLDKSLPIGFVCDNLAFSSDVVITRRHTRCGQARFGEAIASTVAGLAEFRANEARRIELYRGTELSPDRANSLILQAYESGIIGARLLPDVIRQWRTPSHPILSSRSGRHGAS